LSHKGEHIASLLQGCLAGNRQAQLEVYDRYHRAMFNASLRIVKKKDEAEDVMQESFLSAFTKLHTFKGEVAFGAWLKRIVVNNSIQHYRRCQKIKEVTLDDVLYKVEDHEVNVPDPAFTELKAQKVTETMDRLKDNYRMSLTLHLIEGYDYEEVSQIMNISYANCRTMISRAKSSLRKKLLEQEN